MENPFEMDDLGYPHDLGHLHYPFSQKRVHALSFYTERFDVPGSCQVVK